MLEKEHRRLVAAQNEVLHHFFAVVFHLGDDLRRAGMVVAGRGFREVVGVERFVENGRIRPLRKAVHQRRRNIARPTPEANAYWLAHCSSFVR